MTPTAGQLDDGMMCVSVRYGSASNGGNMMVMYEEPNVGKKEGSYPVKIFCGCVVYPDSTIPCDRHNKDKIIATLTAERDDMMRLYRMEHEKHTAALATIAELREELAQAHQALSVAH